MPTVILLDLSLSMLRSVKFADNNELTIKQLAILGLEKFLDTLSVSSKLELISLLGFSSTCEEIFQFTTDYNSLKNTLHNLQNCDDSFIEVGLHGVNKMIFKELDNNTAVQVLLITDGGAAVGPGSVKYSLFTLNQRTIINQFPLPFTFPTKLHIVCITSPDDPNWIRGKPLYQQLVDLCGWNGSVHIPENQLNENSVCNLFQKLTKDMYTLFEGTLNCGYMDSEIILFPSPLPYTKVTSFDCQVFTMPDTIDICGFIPVADVGSLKTISRHLILPTYVRDEENILTKTYVKLTKEEKMIPSFCMLLHRGLSIKNMAAFVMIRENWFGFIYPWTPCKNRSNLLLMVLMPGSNPVLWLGDLKYLHCSENLNDGFLRTFRVKPFNKKSCSNSVVAWIEQSAHKSHIKNILAFARRLPEKTQQFYKQLNHLRKSAIQHGFLEILDRLPSILLQDRLQLPETAHIDCALQLTHAAEAVGKLGMRDDIITPLPTTYNGLK